MLILSFVVVVLGLGWFLGEYTGYGYSGVAIAGVIAVVMSLSSYFTGDKLALAVSGAKGPISKADNAYIYRMVENLAITAGLPKPDVYIIEDSALNAFATGRDPEHASIALTTGIIGALENEELEGVIAHELAHIGNYDIRVMTLVIVLVGVIALLSDFFWRWSFWGGGRSDNRNSSGGNVLMIVGIALVVLSPIIAQLIKLAVSRKREYLADATGSLMTRYPEGLARALEKISAQPAPMKRANNATAHLFISNPFGKKVKKGLAHLFSTHPPIEDRIRTLRNMA